jgi:hypothetical protein
VTWVTCTSTPKGFFSRRGTFSPSKHIDGLHKYFQSINPNTERLATIQSRMKSILQTFASKRYEALESEEKHPPSKGELHCCSSELAEGDQLPTRILQLEKRLRLLGIFSTLLSILLLSLLCFWISHMIFSSRHVCTTQRKWEGCGKSIAEAKSLGCSFDILSKAWLPKGCSRLGSEEYLRDSWSWNHTGWGIYVDRHQTRELTLEDLMDFADSDLKWYGTEREHLVHCAWGLKRVLDGYVNGGRLDYTIQQLHHTTHCVDRLYMSAVKAPDLDVVLGKGNIRLGIC